MKRTIVILFFILATVIDSMAFDPTIIGAGGYYCGDSSSKYPQFECSHRSHQIMSCTKHGRVDVFDCVLCDLDGKTIKRTGCMKCLKQKHEDNIKTLKEKEQEKQNSNQPPRDSGNSSTGILYTPNNLTSDVMYCHRHNKRVFFAKIKNKYYCTACLDKIGTQDPILESYSIHKFFENRYKEQLKEQEKKRREEFEKQKKLGILRNGYREFSGVAGTIITVDRFIGKKYGGYAYLCREYRKDQQKVFILSIKDIVDGEQYCVWFLGEETKFPIFTDEWGERFNVFKPNYCTEKKNLKYETYQSGAYGGGLHAGVPKFSTRISTYWDFVVSATNNFEIISAKPSKD